MLITPSFKKSLIVEQFQGNYLKVYVSMQKKIVKNKLRAMPAEFAIKKTLLMV